MLAGRTASSVFGSRYGRSSRVLVAAVWLLGFVAAAFAVEPLAAAAAGDERSRVAIVRPPDADPLISESVTRLSAELTAAGFDVTVIDGNHESDPRAEVESANLVPAPIAVFTLTRARAGASAEVWLADEITGKTTVRRVDARSTSERGTPSVLAIRAVELLRASLLESAVDAPPPPPRTVVPPAEKPVHRPLPADVARWVGPVVPKDENGGRGRSAHAHALRIAGGGAVLQSFRGFGSAVGLFLRFGVDLDPHWSIRATGIATPLAQHIQRPEGSISVNQQLFEIEGTGALSLGERAALYGSAGLGAYHVQVTGQPRATAETSAPPFLGLSGTLWSLVAGVGSGFSLAVSDTSFVFAEAHLLWSQPEAVITVTGEDVGRLGRPFLVGAVGLAASF